MKVLIFVYTCTAYEKTRALLQENSWADSCDVVFVTDNPNSKLKNNVYLGPYTKSWQLKDPAICKKILELCLEQRYFYYDFYMITDDDSYLFIERLKQYLSFFDTDKPYFIGDYYWMLKNPDWMAHHYKWAAGGCGYVFTKATILKLLDVLKNHNIPLSNEDVWFNEIIKKDLTIQKVHCPGFSQYPETISKYPISIHLNGDMNLINVYHKLISH
jgi:hypothetical protein